MLQYNDNLDYISRNILQQNSQEPFDLNLSDPRNFQNVHRILFRHIYIVSSYVIVLLTSQFPKDPTNLMPIEIYYLRLQLRVMMDFSTFLYYGQYNIGC